MDFYRHYKQSITKYGSIEQYVDHKRKGSQGALVRYLKRQLPTRSSEPIKILELGSGIGTLSYLLAEAGFTVTSLEIDQKMIKLQKELLAVSDAKWDIIEGDLFDVEKLLTKKSFDICLSLGVMEHFTEGLIKRSLEQQSAISQKVVVAVPSINLAEEYQNKSMGDEKFWDITRWLALFASMDLHCGSYSGLLFGKSCRTKLPDWIGNQPVSARLFSNQAAFYVFTITNK